VRWFLLGNSRVLSKNVHQVFFSDQERNKDINLELLRKSLKDFRIFVENLFSDFVTMKSSGHVVKTFQLHPKIL
jgi:hypothetical protein